MLKAPIILVNFKVYKEGSGQEALKLAKIVERVQKDTAVTLGVCVQAVDVYRVSTQVTVPVLAQDYGFSHEGACTGTISPLRLKESGAVGSLLNHSECHKTCEDIELCINLAHEIGFMVVCCAANPADGREFASLGPDFIAVEPPELIGGDVSVSKAQPEVVIQAVKEIGGYRLLVGAGVKNGQDFRTALELGASGVLLASGVVKAVDPEGVLREMVKGFEK